jgi:hypothetical protein
VTRCKVVRYDSVAPLLSPPDARVRRVGYSDPDMAEPTAVNPQITDAVATSDLQTLATAPAQAMGALYIAIGQSLSNAAHNAVTNQQNVFITAQAATTAAIARLLGALPEAR